MEQGIRALVGAVAVIAGAVAGCGDGSDRPVAGDVPATDTTARAATTTHRPFVPAEPVDGLVASIEVSRLFSLDRALALGLQNVGDLPVTVVAIQLDSPLFAPVPVAEEVVLLQPGGRELVMPVPYGEARCEDGTGDGFAAVVVLDDGRELRLETPERNAGGIGRLHARECSARAVLDQVDLRFGGAWEQDGRSVRGDIVLEQRRPGPAVAVDAMAGSVIFGLEAGAGPPILRVTDEEPSDRVEVVISAERCDPHALIESKKTFVFLAWILVGTSDEEIAIEVEPSGTARAALDGLLASCLD